MQHRYILGFGALLGTLACRSPAIEVQGDEAPEPPAGFSTETIAGVDGDGTVVFDVAEGVTGVQVFARVVDPRGDDTVEATVLAGPPDLVGVVQASAFRPEVQFRWPTHPSQANTQPGGTWEIELSGPPDRKVDVTVLQWADTDPQRGTVHVQLVYTDGMRTPEVEGAVETALDRWRAIWEPHGLTVAPYVQTSNAPRRCPNALPPSNGSPVYEALSAAGAEHDVTVVVCERLGGNGESLGVSFGGPLTASPLAATVVRYSELADRLGQTMAHEVGHYAGLRHADEPDGLDDTFECPSGMDRGDCIAAVGQNNLFSSAICGFDSGIEGAVEVDDCLLQDQLTPDQVWLLHTWVGTTE